MRDPDAGLVAAACRTDKHRLPSMELAQADCLAVSFRRLLYDPLLSVANRTSARLPTGREMCTVGAEQLPMAPLAKRAKQRPYLRDGLDRERAVFFTSMP